MPKTVCCRSMLGMVFLSNSCICVSALHGGCLDVQLCYARASEAMQFFCTHRRGRCTQCVSDGGPPVQNVAETGALPYNTWLEWGASHTKCGWDGGGLPYKVWHAPRTKRVYLFLPEKCTTWILTYKLHDGSDKFSREGGHGPHKFSREGDHGTILA